MKLTNVQIAKGTGHLSDGAGLFLKKSGDSGKWIWRFTYLGRRRDMGLGTWPDVSLKDARAARAKWAAVLAQGLNPIDVRKQDTDAARQEEARKDPTFAELVDMVFEIKRAGLRGDGQRGRWRSPLDTHVIPVIGNRRISQIHTTDIRDAIRPIWKTKHVTAEKAVQRTRIVFKEAQLMGFDCDPITVEAGVRMLGEYVHEVKHIPSTPWQDIPDLYRRLGERNSNAARCLQWMMLTLVRSNAARGARVDEVEGSTWIVPAARVKGRVGAAQDFRVPLSAPALELVQDGPFLFPDPYRGLPMSDQALIKLLNKLDEPGRPHGFRTSFRTWVQDTDACPWEVSETILGHSIGGKVERSYARSDLLERRRPVMQAWADYVTGAAGNVVRISG